MKICIVFAPERRVGWFLGGGGSHALTVVYKPVTADLDLEEVGDTASTKPRAISKFPLPPDQRPTTSYFLWQRDPFSLSENEGDGTQHIPGIDSTLPYWMDRYYGVFP